MFAGAILAAAVASKSGPEKAGTYLASISSVRLKQGESIDAFTLKTWGVDFLAVCNIPNDWEITAGSHGPEGRLEGTAGHGASQLRTQDLRRMREIVLIQLESEVQKVDLRDPTGVVPATFQGFVNVQSGWEDRSRRVKLTYANVSLTPAKKCPASR